MAGSHRSGREINPVVENTGRSSSSDERPLSNVLGNMQAFKPGSERGSTRHSERSSRGGNEMGATSGPLGEEFDPFAMTAAREKGRQNLEELPRRVVDGAQLERSESYAPNARSAEELQRARQEKRRSRTDVKRRSQTAEEIMKESEERRRDRHREAALKALEGNADEGQYKPEVGGFKTFRRERDRRAPETREQDIQDTIDSLRKNE